MRRVWLPVLLVLTLAVLAAAVYTIGHTDRVPAAGRTPGYSESAASPTPATSSTSSSSSSTAEPTTKITTAFLGDDYTLGVGDTGDRKSWTYLVSRRLGLAAATYGVRGGGYAKQGGDGRTYDSLVGVTASTHPQLVVVSGGRNDVGDDTDTLRRAAATLFRDLRAKLPDATIVAIAPIWGDSPHPDALTPVDRAVRDGVQAVRGTYLDIADPLYNHPEWMADEGHPNDTGYAAIARSVATALRPVLPAT